MNLVLLCKPGAVVVTSMLRGLCVKLENNNACCTVYVSRSPVELHCISQHPSGHSPALYQESSSPVDIYPALYITALNPDTHYLVSRLQALHPSHHLPAGSQVLCGCLPPVDSTKERDKDDYSSAYRASCISELLHLPVEVAFSLFNKEVLPLLLLVWKKIQV